MLVSKFGLSLFIFMTSLRLISSSMQTAMGRRASQALRRLTSNPFMALITGALITALVQSSSMVAALMIALVNAKKINLKQAFGVILGANIGTTVTAQIITADVSRLAFPVLLCGLFLLLRNTGYRSIGAALVGLGGLFIGLDLMKFTLLPILKFPYVERILIDLSSNIYYGVLVGVIITGLVQSSSAVTGVTIVLAGANAISLLGAIAIALGSNVGTVVTSVIAGIGMPKEAKATAYADLLFNVLGVIIILPLIYPFAYFVSLTGRDVPQQIANAHTIFNVVTAVFALPLIEPLTKITSKWAGITR